MRPIGTFTVSPTLPERLEGLRELAYNLRWAWDHATIELFRRLDSDLWERTGHNPVLMLGMIDQGQLEAAAADDGLVNHLDGVRRFCTEYMVGESTWYRRKLGAPDGRLAAYFSAEFGTTECLSIFAGGLGVLAGDHLKSASDIGLPLVGVGLLYQQGYFRQRLNEAGWQREIYEDNDFYNLPLSLEVSADGTPLTISVDLPGRQVIAQIWRAQVGRVPLYLLDTNITQNSPADRDITDQLYGGDLEMRIKQEIVLGIGGCRALEALGIQPKVYHMNEGHSAFLSLERVGQLMQRHGLSFAEAREAAAAGLVFTTHTPVPAGHDRFPPEMMEGYFGSYISRLGLPLEEFLSLGREDPANASEPFTMTVLALRMADHSNAVSRLHGLISRRMWQSLWPGLPGDEVPVGHVTNGVHFRSWISLEMNQLYDRYLGPRWREEPADPAIWERVWQIPAEELWRTHERRRERLVAFARRRLRAQAERRGAPRAELEAADEALDMQTLTIGFARRFATYKRALLLLRDPDRLGRILADPQRPVQIIFAGKAHPKDDAGKQLIRDIVALARREPFRGRLVFLEDYDVAVARYMVQGTDIWLNTPRRPLEASGTSGMKAAANGVLNASTLDGWWAEAWEEHAPEGPGGWAIGRGEVYDDPEEQDAVEAEAVYAILERDAVPLFYERGAHDFSREWVERMKASIANLCHRFNIHRMVQEYTERFYLPAAKRHADLVANDAAGARALAAWKARVRAGWPALRVESVDSDSHRELRVGGQLRVQAQVQLGGLTPDDVTVELYMGRLDTAGDLVAATGTPMQVVQQLGDGRYLLEATGVACCDSGLHGYTVRVLPRYPGLVTPFLPGLITWAE
ncbi:MAG: alpha-glucan family phosphorylase [Gemmatimonadota bacterium]|nr:MAG: alpha-glucan family phosphorylase [Gemmatimonadota bacterium]